MADDLEKQAAPEEGEDEMAREMAEAMKEEAQALAQEESPKENSGAEAKAKPVSEAPDQAPEVKKQMKPKALSTLEPTEGGPPLGNIDFLLDVPLQVTVNLGNTRMLIKELLQLGQGSIVELEKLSGEPMDVLIGDKLVARGDVVVVNEKFGVRLTDIVSTVDRIQNLG